MFEFPGVLNCWTGIGPVFLTNSTTFGWNLKNVLVKLPNGLLQLIVLFVHQPNAYVKFPVLISMHNPNPWRCPHEEFYDQHLQHQREPWPLFAPWQQLDYSGSYSKVGLWLVYLFMKQSWCRVGNCPFFVILTSPSSICWRLYPQ